MIMRIQLSIFLVLLSYVGLSQNNQLKEHDSIDFCSTIKDFAQGNNYHRYKYLKDYFNQLDSLDNLRIKTEAIDWFGVYRNVIVEKRGETDSVVYIVCHYDKIDGNILAVLNMLINGNLDIITSNIYLSKGVYDNGTGVAMSIHLLSYVLNKDMHYTYRFLFTGLEEYGLRGARTHVSKVRKKDWAKSYYAINIDMIGKAGLNGITVTENVSDYNLVDIAQVICNKSDYPLNKTKLPEGALSDFYIFKGQHFFKDFGISILGNLVGGLIPQRSYFTRYKKGIPVINLTDDTKLSFPIIASMFSPVSFGEIHSFRDKITVVDNKNLNEYFYFLINFIEYIDRNKTIHN
ncbi:M28 family peptidase [Saccharicrinis sp. FJH62]|uniref:M28 family peptidase n=1 Tax=Saccharicrinis sp. FJH62 TaxID=3344657 RepID=UPI0035D47AC2